MPLNFKRLFISVSLVFTFCFFVSAQTVSPPPSAADVMRERVVKAKAYIVVKNYNAAIWLIKNVFSNVSYPVVIAGLNPPLHLINLINNYKHIVLKANCSDTEMQKLTERHNASMRQLQEVVRKAKCPVLTVKGTVPVKATA